MELRYHAPADYRELSDAKKAELKEWRENNKKVGATAAKQVDAATIAAAVAKEIRKFQAMEAKKKESKDEMDAYILSVVKGAANIPKKSDVAAAVAAHAEATAPETPKVPAKLKSILKGKKGVAVLERTDQPLAADLPLMREIRATLNKSLENGRNRKDLAYPELASYTSVSELPPRISCNNFSITTASSPSSAR